MEDFAEMLLMFLCLAFAGLWVWQRGRDMKRYAESYPVINCYADKLCYCTQLPAEEIVERLGRHNVMDVFGYEFRETEKNGCYDLRLKEIRKDYEYSPKQGMVRYELHTEVWQGKTLVVLALAERSSFGAQVRYAVHLNEFMMRKLEAGYIPEKG